MNPAQKRKADLLERVGKLGGHREAIEKAQEQLVERAREQLDTMGPAIHAATIAVDGGGSILAHRYLRELLAERQKLEAVIAGHEDRKKARAAASER